MCNIHFFKFEVYGPAYDRSWWMHLSWLYILWLLEIVSINVNVNKVTNSAVQISYVFPEFLCSSAYCWEEEVLTFSPKSEELSVFPFSSVNFALCALSLYYRHIQWVIMSSWWFVTFIILKCPFCLGQYSSSWRLFYLILK